MPDNKRDRLSENLLAALNEHNGVLLPAVRSLLERQDSAYPIRKSEFERMESSRDLLYNSRQEERAKVRRILEWLDECAKSGAIDKSVASEARILARAAAAPINAAESDIDRALRLRRAYDAGDKSLAAAWVEAENELTAVEYDEYMAKYRASTVTVSPEFKQRVEASSLGTFAARAARQAVSDDVAATVLAHSKQIRTQGANRG